MRWLRYRTMAGALVVSALIVPALADDIPLDLRAGSKITINKDTTVTIATPTTPTPNPIPTPTPVPQVSADGSVLAGGQSGALVTSLGPWSFGPQITSGLWNILLNGSSVGDGSKMQVANGGKLYAIGNDNNWWIVT